MSETLRFDCPACGTHLLVPASAAGTEGPCPRCHHNITAPLPPGPVPSPVPATQPTPPPAEETKPAALPAEPAARRPPASPLLACALTGLIALGIGYGIGRIPHQLPLPAASSSIAPAVTTDVVPPPPAIAAPEAALRHFLAASGHTERLKYCLFPETIAPRLAAWHEKHPDGPIEVSSIKAGHSETDSETGRLLIIFQVATAAMPSGIPIAVMETADGWKVDWESFIEFHADRFKHFAESREGEPADFRLIVRSTDYAGESFAGIERLTAYRLDPPMPDRGQYAFVETDSELQKLLARSTENGHPFTPVLKLAKRTADDGKIYLGIDTIVATDWRPRSP